MSEEFPPAFWFGLGGLLLVLLTLLVIAYNATSNITGTNEHDNDNHDPRGGYS